MPNLYRYNPQFEPVLLEGMTATLFSSFLPAEGINVRAVAVTALPEMENDFGPLAAAVWDPDNAWVSLELGDMEFGQCRLIVVDDMYCRLKNPSSLSLWRTLRDQAWLPQFPFDGSTSLQDFYWKASEFFVWEYHTPRFDLFSSLALAVARIIFNGWRFKVAKIDKPGAFPLWLDSWPTSK